MIANNQTDSLKQLQNENSQLKDCIVLVITELKDMIEDSLLTPLTQNLNAPHLMQELGYKAPPAPMG